MRRRRKSYPPSVQFATQLSRFRRRRVARHLVKWLPATRWADAIVAVLRYIQVHRRAPRIFGSRGLNDHILLQKTGGILLDPLRQLISDKEYVKIYIEARIGPGFTPKTYAILRSDQDIDDYSFSKIPCVVKPTHMSGEAIIAAGDRVRIDRVTLKRWLRENYFRRSREANYRFLRPKIIVEEFISADQRNAPDDYKILCYKGKPRLIQVDSGRFDRHTRNVYDTNWNRMPVRFGFPPREPSDRRPETLELMLDVARRLSVHFELIRVDFYAVGARVTVGELTNCPDGGNARISPSGADLSFGSLLE